MALTTLKNKPNPASKHSQIVKLSVNLACQKEISTEMISVERLHKYHSVHCRYLLCPVLHLFISHQALRTDIVVDIDCRNCRELVVIYNYRHFHMSDFLSMTTRLLPQV